MTFLIGFTSVFAQVSPDCVNAVPICNNTPINGGTVGYGVDDFNGASISGCISLGSGPIESNSAWYRFKTGERGQLGINIGFDVLEDWDFALYRTDDCSNLGDPVRCNYFDNSDNNIFTGFGEDPTGAENFQYDEYLQVQPGEEYYLFINNFSNNNSGFSIHFSGSIFDEFPNTALDCSIINNLLGPPIAACDGAAVVLDGTTLGATGYEWYLDIGSGYQQLSTETGPTIQANISGMYRVLVVMPSGNNIVSEVQVAYSSSPISNPVGDVTICLDGEVFDFSNKKAEALGNQNPDEFRLSFHRTNSDALLGINPIEYNFIPSETTETIYLRTTSLENPDCFDASESFRINGFDIPQLDFESEVFICNDSPSTTIGQPVPNSNYSYSWDTGQTTSEITVNQQGIYTLFVTHEIDNVSCITERSVRVVFSNPPVISDIEIEYIDDDNIVTIKTNDNDHLEYRIDEGYPQEDPVFQNLLPGRHTVTITDLNGCGTAQEEFVIVGFPKFFTPNGDSFNDVWSVGGIEILENPVISIYDRFGKLIHQMGNTDNSWDGTYNGMPVPATDYWFKLSYLDDQGQNVTAKYVNSHFSIKR
ncbi:T9SS type B sorting domain-containing protein [Maribacter sp. PR1]|uniref:T9SS type B sorting domain-containing protein n=1 Tax=Maribacter cobaltidurans TaxID=1178778 RepID=A0ABU7INC5_9FLAO|nr:MULTISPECIES: T9SS type B sorting domain-containing protein [Maribacter]MDC6387079.1 T9SS type B sorting domain-containing protein [Maribacter sp. PR1]MEE1974465.1 T9SS type B sorting domain-containing protein [Maribacter cobaltidurans]